MFVVYLFVFFYFTSISSALDLPVLAEKVCPNEYINFFLYTVDTPDDGYPLLVNNVSNFEAAPWATQNGTIGPTIIVCHGFNENKNTRPNLEIRQAVFDCKTEINVISADYGVLVVAPYYLPAVLNVDVIAQCLGQFVNYLTDKGIIIIKFIGFSIGAQVLGVMSQYVNNQPQIIMGLDPAGPGFTTVSTNKRLDSTDAVEVVVCHTSTIYGTTLSCGKVDLFFNGGVTQPNTTANFPIDNHDRAVFIYAELICKTNITRGTPCVQTLVPLVPGCFPLNGASDQPVLVGENIVPGLQGNFYVPTNSGPPYLP